MDRPADCSSIEANRVVLRSVDIHVMARKAAARRTKAASSVFVVARCDAPPFFQTLDAVFDQMPPFVHLAVMEDGRGWLQRGLAH